MNKIESDTMFQVTVNNIVVGKFLYKLQALAYCINNGYVYKTRNKYLLDENVHITGFKND